MAEGTGRPNQRRRTRKDLLRAAARLMRDGRSPSLEEIAEEALVSRATAYRYFPGVEALLLEASLDVAVPEPDEVFRDAPTDDPVTRLELADAALDDMVHRNEAALRTLVAHTLQRIARGEGGEDGVPARQNRRTPLIETALWPARAQLDPAEIDSLTKALALVIGTEAFIVLTDVLQLDAAEARRVRQWAIRALVAAARKTPARPGREV